MKIIHKVQFLKPNNYLEKDCRKAKVTWWLPALCNAAVCQCWAASTCGVADLGLESDTCEWPTAY